MRRKIYIILVLLACLLVLPTANALDNSGGGYWKRVDVFPFATPLSTDAQYCVVINNDYINITNSTGALKVSLKDPSFWSYVNSSGADIRFTNQVSELYFWVQSWNYTAKKAKIWVNVTTGSTELKLYYYNPSAVPSIYLNGSKTFELFDDFNTLSNEWVSVSGTWAVSNGQLYVSSDYGAAPGDCIVYIGKRFSEGSYVVYTYGTDNNDFGITVNAQGTTVSSAFDTVTVNIGLSCAIIDEWDGAWGTSANAPITCNAGDKLLEWAYQKGDTLYQFAKDLTNGAYVTNSRTVSYTSGYIGLREGALFTTSSKWDWVFVASLSDPANFETPFTSFAGKTISNAAIVNVTYNAFNITGMLRINNSTTLITPQFNYYPSNLSNTGYLAVGKTVVNGNVTITIYLNKTLSLNKVVCNGTVVTPVYIGVTTINDEEYNTYNFTSPSAGELIITANATPTTLHFNKTIIFLQDNPNIPMLHEEFIRSVNSTYGANITVLVNTKLNLSNIQYNDTSINLTYKGTLLINGQTYNEYIGEVYSDGLVNITMYAKNIAYNTKVYADNSLNYTEVLVGEPLKVETPAPATITIDTTTYNHTTTMLYIPHTPGFATIYITIFNTSTMQFGNHKIIIPIIWGSINVTLLNYNNQTMNMQYGIYNMNFSTVSLNPHRLYAGWNKLTVFYLGQPIKVYTFYLNHTNQGMNVTIKLNATSINSTCYTISAISPTTFKVINLHKLIPYGKFAVNHTGEVIIHFVNNSPVTVTVKGSRYSYYAPYLYIYGSGNATVVPYYKLRIDAENALGIPMNLSIKLNGKDTEIYGITNKILPVNQYQIEFPKTFSGFVLKNENLTSISLNLTSNKEIPPAIYKVPTYISLVAYKINTTSFRLPIPLPFVMPLNTHITNAQKACIDGRLYNWYGVPVPNANVTIKITSLKTGYTLTKHVNTGVTGTFNVTFDVASGVNYSISAIYRGSGEYVESYKHIVVAGGALPPAPSSNKHNMIILSAIAITILGIGVGLSAYILHKRSISKAMSKLSRGKYFRRVK